MKTPSKRAAVAAAIGVWVAALSAAAALAYTVNRTTVPEVSHVVDDSVMMSRLQGVNVVPPQRVIELAPITIYGEAPPKAAPATHTLHCAQWRELSMGSGSVQICD